MVLAKLRTLLGSAAIRELCYEGGLFCLKQCLSDSWAEEHTNKCTQSSPVEPLAVIHFTSHECLSVELLLSGHSLCSEMFQAAHNE